MMWRVRHTDGKAESSAEYGSGTSSASFTKLENILDDNGEGTSERDTGARTSREDGATMYLREKKKPPSADERSPRFTINWDLFATLAGFWEDSAMDNIDEEYDRLVEHLHNCTKKAESSKSTKRCLSFETSELTRQRGAERAAGNQELTSELRKNTRYTRRDVASRKTRMTASKSPKGTTIASRKGMEKIVYDFYSDFFNSHVHLPHLRKDGHVIPEVLPPEVRHAIMSVRNRTAPGSDRIRPEHLKNLTHQHSGEAIYTLPV
ncbi:hypothetical protein RB195_010227 [Necator americanus]|uniref:Reverse transcriptase domain-containing protein n=1 Tax=Necator americanus TaxID=51031 RepID=A0ABR1CYE5_NECAM